MCVLSTSVISIKDKNKLINGLGRCLVSLVPKKKPHLIYPSIRDWNFETIINISCHGKLIHHVMFLVMKKFPFSNWTVLIFLCCCICRILLFWPHLLILLFFLCCICRIAAKAPYQTSNSISAPPITPVESIPWLELGVRSTQIWAQSITILSSYITIFLKKKNRRASVVDRMLVLLDVGSNYDLKHFLL